MEEKNIRIDEGTVEYLSYWYSDIESVTFSPKVRYIGEGEFSHCEKLKEVVFEGEGPIEFGPRCFEGCSSLKSIRLPEIHHIPYRCFAESGLEEIELPKGVIAIDAYAFYFCRNLTSVKLPDTLLTIGERAFKTSEARFERLDLSRIVSLGEEAFHGCHIKHLIIGQSHEAIPYGCFFNCGIEYAELLPLKKGDKIDLRPQCLAWNPNMTIKLPGAAEYWIQEDAFFCRKHVWMNVSLPDPYRNMRLLMPNEEYGYNEYEDGIYKVSNGSIRIERY